MDQGWWRARVASILALGLLLVLFALPGTGDSLPRADSISSSGISSTANPSVDAALRGAPTADAVTSSTPGALRLLLLDAADLPDGGRRPSLAAVTADQATRVPLIVRGADGPTGRSPPA